ncbi:hypothetical protein SASPL_117344 [Salvia splendens]|uniref:Nucleolus and neural progenitor protein-like N-terminal domain-containing protein n=1 Tax=Salvia splendens TaxID=180675 RepID=A0A8X8XVL1_SALSN|nr:hypothetical protein SASPL_117344 [Salvia splendens]
MPIHCYNWIQMDSNIKTVEQRLKSFTSQLHTECGILERLVYKHKNQHRRSSYFQYILKVCNLGYAKFLHQVRRDLQLLKSLNLDEVLESSFLVIHGDRPKQKVQLLEGLKRRKTNSGKYNFLERLLGVTRLLSQIVEPLLKAAIEISMLLARSFFMKFSLVVLAVLARVRVLVQQMLLDAVLLYNTVSSLSLKEQSIKLKQEGFELMILGLQHLYILQLMQTMLKKTAVMLLDLKKDEKNVPEASDIAPSSTANIVSLEDVFTNSSAGSFSDTSRNKFGGDASCSVRTSEAEVTRIETSHPAFSTTPTVSRPFKKETRRLLL